MAKTSMAPAAVTIPLRSCESSRGASYNEPGCVAVAKLEPTYVSGETPASRHPLYAERYPCLRSQGCTSRWRRMTSLAGWRPGGESTWMQILTAQGRMGQRLPGCEIRRG